MRVSTSGTWQHGDRCWVPAEVENGAEPTSALMLGGQEVMGVTPRKAKACCPQGRSLWVSWANRVDDPTQDPEGPDRLTHPPPPPK